MPKPVKKKAKKVAKPTKRAPSAIVRPTIAQILEVASSRTQEATTLFAERLDILTQRSTEEILQDDLASSQSFRNLSKAAARPYDAFSALVKARLVEAEKKAREENLAEPTCLPNIERGSRVLTFEDNRKVTIAWKDEAARHAQILHAVAAAYAAGDEESLQTLLRPFDGPFDAALWEAAIKKGKEKTGTLTPKIVEG